jgi:DnaJ-class molecular chaperone
MSERHIIPCQTCGGEGRIFKSRYGGNDPDVWDAGQCETCAGSGNQTCEECAAHPAVAVWSSKTSRLSWFVCEACHNEWLEDEAA